MFLFFKNTFILFILLYFLFFIFFYFKRPPQLLRFRLTVVSPFLLSYTPQCLWMSTKCCTCAPPWRSAGCLTFLRGCFHHRLRTVGRVQLPRVIKGRHLIFETWLTITLCVCVCVCGEIVRGSRSVNHTPQSNSVKRIFLKWASWIWIWAQTPWSVLLLCTPVCSGQCVGPGISLCHCLITSQLNSVILQACLSVCVRVIKVHSNQTLGNSPSTLPAFSPNTARQEEEVAGQEMQERDGSHVCFLSVLLAPFDGRWFLQATGQTKSAGWKQQVRKYSPVSSSTGTRVTRSKMWCG